jgi:hypothetical protein
MAQILSHMAAGRQTGRSNGPPGANHKGAGGLFDVVKTYWTVMGAAVHTTDAEIGHPRLTEGQMKELGIKPTPAASAVIRH